MSKLTCPWCPLTVEPYGVGTVEEAEEIIGDHVELQHGKTWQEYLEAREEAARAGRLRRFWDWMNEPVLMARMWIYIALWGIALALANMLATWLGWLV